MNIKILGNSHLKEKTNKLLQGSKKLASELYEEGKHTVADVGDNLKGYSKQVTQKIHERPLATLLLVGGLSLIVLSTFLRR
ncbi:hypothetical protein [Legionella brunensis]|uniref:DUF883 domain-containing protein n=1 Tax=Legionella brunensis TaxID=29422 RepID=A0A0W0S0V6_9GAMM|nr:hypothetical protein [Legionella brunensis]KTC76936.1 hypothetical protein Lbru_3043 [Legionella brunensis]